MGFKVDCVVGRILGESGLCRVHAGDGIHFPTKGIHTGRRNEGAEVFQIWRSHVCVDDSGNADFFLDKRLSGDWD